MPRNGVAEGEDAAVGSHEPVAGPLGVETMPTIGGFSRMRPVDP